MAGEGVTVLLSSHLLGEVEDVCSDVVVMDRGRLVAAGSVTQLMSTAASTAYLEVDDVAKARTLLSGLAGVRGVVDAPPGLAVDLDAHLTRAGVVAALVQAGIGVDTVMQRARLEDVFVGLVGEETMRH
jgi:ABC-2 type transport system ATP-binding protein